MRRFIHQKLVVFKEVDYVTNLDFMRGMAALMVVFYHFVIGNPHRFDAFPSLQYVASFGHLGVNIFFVISGFVIPYSMYKANYELRYFGKFILKRLARLEPPYLISVLICILLAYLAVLNPFYHGSFPDLSLTQILLHIAYLNAFFHYDWINVVYWTLAIEFQYYLIIALVYPLLISLNNFSIISIWLVSTILSLLIPYSSFIFFHLPFFLLGVTLFLVKTEKIDANFGIASLLYCLFWITLINDHIYFLVGVGCVLLIVMGSIKHPIWSFLGGISYSLYLLHVPFGQRIMNLADNFIHNEYLMFLVLIVCVLLTIAVSYLYKLLVENPSHQLSKRIKY